MPNYPRIFDMSEELERYHFLQDFQNELCLFPSPFSLKR